MFIIPRRACFDGVTWGRVVMFLPTGRLEKMMAGKALYLPTHGRYRKLTNVPFEDLPSQLDCLILDVDNTLVDPLHSLDVSPSLIVLLRHQKRIGRIRQIALVSNMVVRWHCREERIELVAEAVGADHVIKAYWPNLKPKPGPFQEAMAAMGSTPATTMVIGDQCSTDIVGGNRLGIATIKVDPTGSDPLWTWLKRRWENWQLRHVGYG